MNCTDYSAFYKPLLTWYDQHGRKNLPWQHPRSAYRVWISEIMLQQTQVKTVIPYFIRFMERFTDISALAQAPEDAVLSHWSGLGYYSRARNIHKTAKIICDQYQGHFPEAIEQLILLPGIGPSTAAAIVSQAFNKQAAILDGNVKRVLCRYFQIGGWPEQSAVKQLLWQLAKQCMPDYRCADYTQAIMDLGATCCTSRNPGCSACPVQQTCLANLHGTVAQYPQKKLKKVLPVRHEQFLLLHSLSNQIYLEKRPPTGLWGGLWCTPIINSEACPVEYIATSYALDNLHLQPLLEMKHTFSHFHLHIKASALQTRPMENKIMEQTGKWFHAEELKDLGLPKPVSDIILRFLAHQPQLPDSQKA